jgi:hypothetical protein
MSLTTPLQCRHRSRVEIIQEQTQRISRRFKAALAGRTAAGYLALLCVGFESHYEAGNTTRAKDFFMEKEVELRKIQRALERHQEIVFKVAGEGEQWNEIEGILVRVRRVIHLLDNLLCMGMVDPANLVKQFHAKHLEFQTDP